MVAARQVMSKSILCRSSIPNITYAVNPYIGCEHKCVYCYARFMKRFTGHPEAWGEFVDMKANAAQVLALELPRKTKGLTYLSSVTDPYQPLEKKYELTMSCLQELLAHQFPITIQTKSSLVLRDIDLLAEFPECDVGFTITSTDDEVIKKSEPCSSPVEERLAALEELHDREITTYAFLGPILPHITDDNQSLHSLIHSLARVKVNHVLVDRLNLRWGVWPSVVNFLNQYYPKLTQEYKRIFWSRNDYFEKVKLRIIKLCDQHGVRCEFCF
ncbi:MAG: radical SAM protein [Candidatus Bathyarchaeota archaeon]|nr:MAG: radical SAM protein [Candidatus Bathyarchaeota archaeon]